MNELIKNASKQQNSQCIICQSSVSKLATYCSRCNRLKGRVDTRKGSKTDIKARIQALIRSWDSKMGCFKCEYTKIRLEERDHTNPRYLTFDHRTPRKEQDIAVCASFVNDMKSDLSYDEFQAVVIELAKAFQGGVFDERCVDFEHWNRGEKKCR